MVPTSLKVGGTRPTVPIGWLRLWGKGTSGVLFALSVILPNLSAVKCSIYVCNVVKIFQPMQTSLVEFIDPLTGFRVAY